MKTLALLLTLWLAVSPALAGTRIDELSSVDSLAATDQVPVYDASNDDTRKASMTTIAAYVSTVLDAQLLALAGLSPTADTAPYFTSATAAALMTVTAFARTLLDDTDAAAARTTLGLVIGTNVQAYDADLAAIAALTTTAAGLALLDDANAAAQRTTLGLVIGTDVQAHDADLTTLAAVSVTAAGTALLDDANAAAQRTTLGLVIGTDVQAYDAELAALAGLTSAADRGIMFTGAGTAAVYPLTAFALTVLDDGTAAAARTTLDAQQLDAELTAIAGLTSAANKGITFTGAGTASTYDLSAFALTILDDANAAAVLTTIGAQPLDAELSAIAGLTSAADKIPYYTGSGTAGLVTIGSGLAFAAGTLSATAAVPSVADTFTRRLQIDRNAVDQVTVSADAVVLVDSSNNGATFRSVASEVADIDLDGAGGLDASDTNDEASTWYEVYLIGKADGTVDAFLNKAGTAIGTTPTDYIYSAHVGYVRNNASSAFIDFFQQGPRSIYRNDAYTDNRVASAATETTFTARSCAALIPPKSRLGLFGCQASATDNIECHVRATGSTATNAYTIFGSGTASIIGPISEQSTDSSQSIDTKGGGSGSPTHTVWVHGYVLPW